MVQFDPFVQDAPISASVSRTIGRKPSSAFSATLTSVRTIVSLSGIRTPAVPLPAAVPCPVEVEGKAVSASSITVRTSLSACVFSAADLGSRANVLSPSRLKAPSMTGPYGVARRKIRRDAPKQVPSDAELLKPGPAILIDQ